jgi:hypothetical protein
VFLFTRQVDFADVHVRDLRLNLSIAPPINKPGLQWWFSWLRYGDKVKGSVQREIRRGRKLSIVGF